MSSLQRYIIALDFGYPIDPQQRSSIDDLADFIVREYADEPETVVLAQECICGVLRQRKFPRQRLLEVATGQSGTNGLESGGSYHMLRAASSLLDCIIERPEGIDDLPGEEGPVYLQATVVAHSLHVWRVVRQGWLFGLELTPAKGLPTALYRNAAQWWCRSRFGWYLREVIGFIPLWLARQI